MPKSLTTSLGEAVFHRSRLHGQTRGKDLILFEFLNRLFRTPRLEHLHFVLCTRQGCHLCDDAHLLLQQEQHRYHFRLEIVDVDTDPSLAEQFGEQVPAVIVNGQIRFRSGLNPVLLHRLLQAESRLVNR